MYSAGSCSGNCNHPHAETNISRASWNRTYPTREAGERFNFGQISCWKWTFVSCAPLAPTQKAFVKAYELYQQRGESAGHDLNDWFTAERLVRAELLHGSALAKEEGAVIEDETT